MQTSSRLTSSLPSTLLALIAGCVDVGEGPTNTAATGSSSTEPATTTTPATTTVTTTDTSSSTSSTNTTSTTTSTDSSSTTPATDSGTTEPPPCGNGSVDVGETCDSGKNAKGEQVLCRDDCTYCGDMVPNGVDLDAEECDDGNTVDTDACLSTCELATCGDGYVQADIEECEDGNQTDDDNCSNECIIPRIVFVTSATYTGNMGKPMNMTGLAAADFNCETAANAMGSMAPQNKQWLAWLSTNTDKESPSGRFDTTFSGHYKLLSGASIAKGWTDLTDNTLAAPILVTEEGTTIDLMNGDSTPDVWTGTDFNGTVLPDEMTVNQNCTGWTVMGASPKGKVGNISAVGSTWTKSETKSCSTIAHLYCFQHTL